MSKEQTSNITENVQDEQNETLLDQSELGVILADAYRTATDLEPRLMNMKIVPIEDANEKAHGYAVAKDVSESGEYEVHIRLNDLDEVLDYYSAAIGDFPASTEIINKRLRHVEPNKVTPQLLYVQSVLHEMGHVVEYMDHEDNMGGLRQRNKQERAALPLGYTSLTKLVDPTSELRQRVDQHWDELSSKHGVESVEELVGVQGEAYRNLTSETVADNFATDVFATNPQLYDQLTQQAVDKYRKLPQVS